MDLRRFDVYPFPFDLAVHWTDEGYQFDLVAITAADENGYTAVTITSHTVPYSTVEGDDGRDEQQSSLEFAQRAAVKVFAARFARALAD